MALITIDNFANYQLGMLSLQGNWNAQQGPAYPIISVVDGSALGEGHAVSMIDGEPTGVSGIDRLLGRPMTEGRITFKAQAKAGSAGTQASQFYLLLLSGAIDLVGFTTDAFYVGFIEGSDAGAGFTRVVVYDDIGNPGMADTAIPIGDPFTVDLDILAGGAVKVYAGGVLVPFGTRQLYAGNETLLRYGFSAAHNPVFFPPIMSGFGITDNKSPFPVFFRAEPLPAILDVDPEILDTYAPTPVVITGQGFRDVGVSDAVSVIFGSSTVTGTAVSSTRIETIAPPKPPRGMASFNVIVNFTNGLQLVSGQVIVYT